MLTICSSVQRGSLAVHHGSGLGGHIRPLVVHVVPPLQQLAHPRPPLRLLQLSGCCTHCGAWQSQTQLMAVGRLGGNPPHILLVNTDQHVLRLDVCVDDLALRVQVVQPFKHLLHHDLHVGQVDPLVVASDDELQQIVTQHLS